MKTVLDMEMDRPTKPSPASTYESVLLFCGIAFAGIVGSYIRVGDSYYHIWRAEINYCLMYTQILGCFILGYCLKFKRTMFDESNSRSWRVLYIVLTSGLCGSITSFSTWQLECNKNFFLQWDFSWGNAMGSYNGGRFFEWLVCMWSGVVVPIAAMHLGHFAASAYQDRLQAAAPASTLTSSPSAPSDPAGGALDTPMMESTAPLIESSILAFFFVTLVLTLVLPTAAYPQWSHLMYTAVFGATGAYARYLVCKWLNPPPGSSSFPLGTFTVNVLGTWVAAIIMTVSKFAVPYYNHEAQAVLYGMMFGFCGSFTTVSSFAKEVDDLPAAASYKYAIATHAAAQAGIILLYNAYAYTTIPKDSVMPPPIKLCFVSDDLCGNLLDKIGCPIDLAVNIACDDMHDYATYQGVCDCGNFSTDRISLLIIDAQSKANVTQSMVNVWPTDALSIKEPTEVFDFCLTFENLCDHYLNRIGCPANLRSVSGCKKEGITNDKSVCVCGSHDSGSERIQELMVDVAMARRYDQMPYNGFITLDYVDFGTAYEDLCSKMLDHFQCPAEYRCITGNQLPQNFSTWEGTCLCSTWQSCPRQPADDDAEYIPNYAPVDVSIRVAEDLFDAMMRPMFLGLLVRPDPTVQVWDVCASYFNICSYFMGKIACPIDEQVIDPCGNVSAAYPHGTVDSINAVCQCGAMDTLNERQYELVIDALTFEKLWNEYLHIPPPNPAYNLVIGTNPFKQLSQPGYTLPLQ